MTRSYEGPNRTSWARMEALADSLPDTTLAQPMGNGWTIAGAFAHLAFWDRAVIARWDYFRQNGEFPPGGKDWQEIVNAAASAQWQALPPRWSTLDAVSAASSANDFLSSLTEDEVNAAHRAGFDAFLDRSIHRNAHLDDIETSLRAG